MSVPKKRPQPGPGALLTTSAGLRVAEHTEDIRPWPAMWTCRLVEP